ncbi:transglycosylase SLT domain-containing protein [Coxiella endosymbiont of Amblyomma nuttalli]|uniref:transglycosylase SLT domain-containing protein n=1 Tax=Coxiella endosymbiont of Amblyomma nuttalli TaxID=2749996 RepID=UPI001BA886E6|nr:transglycosylase SLT domain-containing protein [Coxiella endosymbiont of Amblyomma nuttalli]QTS83839.1 Membrane-bound lytic murein transglycosylase D precursor [Coxiella endosymbiont of Amblyomma nuttalli]QTS84045.1 Membrane-bound lytic murein transglycosylase D precursor [Coxiella endosymbiont of Amblyomma nuttalli]
MQKWIFNTAIALLAFYLISVTTIAMSTSRGGTWNTGDLLSHHQQNFWTAISQQFVLAEQYTNNYYVRKQIQWFCQQQYYLSELTKNARPYIYYVFQQTKKRGIPPEIALLPMIESNYNPFLYSKRGATGLWQLMPGTATGFSLLINWWYDGRRDVVASTNAALNYLEYLHDYFHSWLLAIAAYDAGEGTVAVAIRYNRLHRRPTDFWSLPLPYETREYVPKLLALADVIKNHQYYGLQLNPVKNGPFFTMISLKTRMNLRQLVTLSDSTLNLIRRLNPGFRRSTTFLHDAYNFLVPLDKANHLEQSLVELEASRYHKRLLEKWAYHRVHSGDSLSILANRYHTSIAKIRRINKLKSDMIGIGKNLLIPEAEATPYIPIRSSSISKDNVPELRLK